METLHLVLYKLIVARRYNAVRDDMYPLAMLAAGVTAVGRGLLPSIVSGLARISG
jgi:hypothetical protein